MGKKIRCPLSVNLFLTFLKLIHSIKESIIVLQNEREQSVVSHICTIKHVRLTKIDKWRGFLWNFVARKS